MTDMREPIARLHRDGRGLTLVEILVVIAIIGLLVAVSIPALNAFSKGEKLKSAGRLFQSAFDLAKRYAVNTRKSHHVLFLEDKLIVYGKEVKTLTVSKTGEETLDENDDAAAKGILPKKAEIALGKFVSYELGFRKDNYATRHAQSLEEAIANLDKYAIEFKPDGSINFENFTDVPRDYIGNSDQDIEPKGADVYIRIEAGSDKRWCYLDIDPASGRTRMNVAPGLQK